MKSGENAGFGDGGEGERVCMSSRLSGDNVAGLRTPLSFRENLGIQLFGSDFMRLGVDFYMCQHVFVNKKNG